MKRFWFLAPTVHACPKRRGYTLVELLTATVLMLIVMGVVVQVFGLVGRSVSDSRATLEMNDELRSAAARLEADLAGVTVTMIPPRDPANDEGYFEYIEGPIGPVVAPEVVARNNDTAQGDSTFIDADDILMFTTRSEGQPFVGKAIVKRPGTAADNDNAKYPDGDTVPFKVSTTVESNVSEVAWFVRGRTLYRRVLLVNPQHDADLRTSTFEPWLPTAFYDAFYGAPNRQGFYNNYDLSIHLVVNPADPTNTDDWQWVPNTLSDLTKRENRFAHQSRRTNASLPLPCNAFCYPFHPHRSVRDDPLPRVTYVTNWASLGLPILQECSHPNWVPGSPMPRLTLNAPEDFDPWTNPHPWNEVIPTTGTLTVMAGPRIAEDVILNNVIGFDVKAWDPGAPLLGVTIGGTQTVVAPDDPGYVRTIYNYFHNTGPIPVSFGAYVDLNYMCLLNGNYPRTGDVVPTSYFNHAGNSRSFLQGTPLFLKDFTDPTSWPPVTNWRAATYDTWSTHYEMNGLDEDGDGTADEGANGFDDNGNGIVDDPDEQEAPAPYPTPLRGIQVKLRVFDPDSRQIREVTIVQDFLDK